MKKRIYCFFLILMIFFSACTKTKKEFYPSGQLKSEIQYKGKIQEGYAIYYFSTGSKQIESFYLNGKLDGKFTRWYYNGNIERIDHYKNDTLHGSSKVYYENGQIQTEINYIKGNLSGKYNEYFENGQIKVDGSFVDGLYNGEWMYYDINGIPIGNGNYTLGDGTHVSFYYPTTDTLVSSPFVDNLKQGREIWYHKDGSIKEIRTFSEGNMIKKEIVNQKGNQ